VTHRTRFLITLVAPPIGFFFGLLAAAIGQLNPIGYLVCGAVLASTLAYVPLAFALHSLMRGVDILETLRAAAPSVKQQPRKTDDPTWLR
jgi:hypothetical protein